MVQIFTVVELYLIAIANVVEFISYLVNVKCLVTDIECLHLHVYVVPKVLGEKNTLALVRKDVRIGQVVLLGEV